ncbi:uncharacterized protein BROUX77_001356 [Berkeleyomyces rouxiae]|uniref:uncharacterized protein n=1 Tax=Berkeleyomyces rouxiae TaxID=2035830 RepID=UPI003B7D0D50
MAPSKRPSAASRASIVPSVEVPSRIIPESQILRPANAKASDAEWPVFELYDAVVMDKTRSFVRNLLRVEDIGPFVVQGRVCCDTTNKAQIAQLLHPKNFRPVEIEIEASSMSIGLDSADIGEDGGEPLSGPVIWAKSYYGFFRIASPAPCYRAMFNHTLEAITLYYSIMGVYEAHDMSMKRHSKKGKARITDIPLEEVFLKYAVMIGDGCVLEEVKERCMIHAAFLASHFRFETDFSWEGKAFTKYIKGLVPTSRAWEKKNLDVTSVHDDGLDDPDLEPQAYVPPLASDGSRSRSPTGASASISSTKSSPPPRSRTLAQSSRISAVASSAKESSKEPKPVWETDVASRSRPKKTTPSISTTREASQTPTATSNEPQRPENPVARELFTILPDLIIDRAPGRVSLKSLYNITFMSLTIKTRQGGREIVNYAAKDLIPLMESDTESREWWLQTKLWTDLQETPPFQGPLRFNSSVESMVKQLQKRQKQVPSRGQKRPHSDIRALTSGKTSLLRPHKRSVLGTDTDSNSTTSWRKSPTVSMASTPVDADLDMVDASDYDEFTMARRDEDYQHEYEESDIHNDRNINTPPINPIKLVIRSEPMPTTTPNGPNGTWLCGVKGCRFIERDAEDDRGQESIKRHIQAHGTEAARIDLAMTESHGHTIGYLLEKLKNTHNDPGSDDGNPKPPSAIKRRFFGYV